MPYAQWCNVIVFEIKSVAVRICLEQDVNIPFLQQQVFIIYHHISVYFQNNSFYSIISPPVIIKKDSISVKSELWNRHCFNDIYRLSKPCCYNLLHFGRIAYLYRLEIPKVWFCISRSKSTRSNITCSIFNNFPVPYSN